MSDDKTNTPAQEQEAVKQPQPEEAKAAKQPSDDLAIPPGLRVQKPEPKPEEQQAKEPAEAQPEPAAEKAPAETPAEAPPAEEAKPKATPAKPEAKVKPKAAPAKPAAKAPSKPADKAKAAPAGKGKAEPKKGAGKADKAATPAPKKPVIERDKYGFKKGSLKSRAAEMYSKGKGATLGEIKEALGSSQLNLIKELEDSGKWKVERTKEAGKGKKPVTRYKLSPATA